MSFFWHRLGHFPITELFADPHQLVHDSFKLAQSLNLFHPDRTRRLQAGAECVLITSMLRVGIGYDVHRLVEGRKLVLGGEVIPHEKGLDGHSDADVLMHAICDAILGALGEGDIGQFFPNTDPRWLGAASKLFLQEAARQVKFRNGTIINVDSTILAQQPKVMPHAKAMRIHIAEALGIQPQRIGIKATTGEGLGFIGREEGIAAMAVAGVELPE
jgi:2-C-methyl-D-erythritol 2,4-cyclodiphosphate synthase